MAGPRRPADEPTLRPTHPRLAAAVLMIGVALVLVLLAYSSL